MVQWIWPVLQNLGFQVSDTATPIYEDSEHNVDIIKIKHITSWVKHISIPIHYVHEQNVC